MENIVTAIFSVESEAYQAFTQIRQKPYGEGYVVAELAQLKREGDAITVVEACDTAAVTSNDTAAGMAVGALAGILGGPLGVLLGAYTGTVAGAAFDAADTVDSMALLEATAAKLMDGDVAIIALVQEEEPAFDKPFEGYDTMIIRHFAADVIQEVDSARELGAELANEAHQKLVADKKAETQQKVEEHKAEVHERFEKAKAAAGDALDEMGAELEGAAKAVKDKATGAE